MNHIIILNDGDYWPKNAEASVRAAAQRWGGPGVCRVNMIDSRLGADDIFGAKFRAPATCVLYPEDRGLLLDSDILIRSDCPSPWDVVPDNHFGAVCNYQGDTHLPEEGGHETHQKPSWDTALAMLNFRAAADPGGGFPYSPGLYINGGFIVFSHRHLPVFAMLRERITDTTGVNEQGGFSVALAMNRTVYLPREWNRIGPAVWEHDPAKPMDALVYHFANYMNYRGREEKARRIDAIDWRKLP